VQIIYFHVYVKDNSEVELQEVELEGLEWIYVSQDIEQFLALMNMNMELSIACGIITITRLVLPNAFW
jgi:hypothetical protein